MRALRPHPGRRALIGRVLTGLPLLAPQPREQGRASIGKPGLPGHFPAAGHRSSRFVLVMARGAGPRGHPGGFSKSAQVERAAMVGRVGARAVQRGPGARGDLP